MDELYICILVPANVLALHCARRLPKKYKDRTYDLREYDPDYLVTIVNLLKRANPSQLIVNRRKSKNRKTERALERYNQENPDTPYKTLEDIIACVDISNYHHSTMSTEPGYEGEELHIFKNVVVPGFSRNADTKVYVKIIDPDGQYPIDVISVHRNCDQ